MHINWEYPKYIKSIEIGNIKYRVPKGILFDTKRRWTYSYSLYCINKSLNHATIVWFSAHNKALPLRHLPPFQLETNLNFILNTFELES